MGCALSLALGLYQHGTRMLGTLLRCTGTVRRCLRTVWRCNDLACLLERLGLSMVLVHLRWPAQPPRRVLSELHPACR